MDWVSLACANESDNEKLLALKKNLPFSNVTRQKRKKGKRTKKRRRKEEKEKKNLPVLDDWTALFKALNIPGIF